ncbi:MAG: hypothetical protein JL50_19140 [Peptococcaceae bacterium BICA1-7]|nr:MAG: hypothetical protein JL50_19140 [Peptococcaceae bacterium BICA1-7]HBV98944.1 hypothetical protein [Desulfotomaculum sp.]
MDHNREFMDTLTSFHSDLNRIQTMAGTLSQIERDHFNDLSKYEDQRLAGIAVAEQNSARQLGEIKQLCIAMAQRIQEIQGSLDNRREV